MMQRAQANVIFALPYVALLARRNRYATATSGVRKRPVGCVQLPPTVTTNFRLQRPNGRPLLLDTPVNALDELLDI